MLLTDSTPGDSITSTTTKLSYTILDLGIMSPKEMSIASHPTPAARVLRKGMVGYIVCGMKDVTDGTLYPCPPELDLRVTKDER